MAPTSYCAAAVGIDQDEVLGHSLPPPAPLRMASMGRFASQFPGGGVWVGTSPPHQLFRCQLEGGEVMLGVLSMTKGAGIQNQID